MQKALIYWGVLCFGVCAVPQTKGQSPAVPPANTSNAAQSADAPPDWGNFETVFSALSEKYRIAILCESAPYQPVLAPDAANNLQKSSTPNLTKQEQITLAARAYDYEPVFVDKKTALLIKRYTSPQDLPEVPLDEAALFVNHVLQETAPLRDGTDDTTESLLRSLLSQTTPEQRVAYEKGVPWSSLPADFQKRYAAAYTNRPVKPAEQGLVSLAARLNGMQQTERVFFKTASVMGISVPVCEGPFSSSQTPNPTQFYLSSLFKGGLDGKQSFPSNENSRIVDGKLLNPPRDFSVPFEQTRPNPNPRLSRQKSLKEIARELNARLAASGANSGETTGVVVPRQIEEKTITRFGVEAALSPLLEIKAIAQVIGLRGAQGSDGIARISLPPVRLLTDRSQIPGELLRLAPASYLRALGKVSPENARIVVPGEMNGPHRDDLYYVALQRVRALVEPKLAQQNPLPLADAPAPVKDLMVLFSLADSAPLFQGLSRTNRGVLKMPEFINGAVFKAHNEGEFLVYDIRVKSPELSFSGGGSIPAKP